MHLSCYKQYLKSHLVISCCLFFFNNLSLSLDICISETILFRYRSISRI